MRDRGAEFTLPTGEPTKSTESIDTRSDVRVEFLHSSSQESAFHSGAVKEGARGEEGEGRRCRLVDAHCPAGAFTLHLKIDSWSKSRFRFHLVLPGSPFFQPAVSVLGFVGAGGSRGERTSRYEGKRGRSEARRRRKERFLFRDIGEGHDPAVYLLL